MSITTLVVRGGLGAGALAAVALFAGLPVALANEDPAADPPNCTSADLEGVRAGVEAATSAYLFTHPDLNAFMGTTAGLSRADTSARVKTYMVDHPQEQAEMAGIRQPLMDIKERCGAPPAP